MSSGASTSDPIAKALATARTWFAVAKTKIAGMSRAARVLAIGTAVAAVVLLTWVGWRGVDPSYTTLYANLDREDAAAIVAKLKEQKVPYRLGEDGSTIAVPEDRARELRLDLAGAGLPRGGGVGFESFDKMRLGATEFEQRVLYRRSLEGELGRTIDTISAVQSSRVHLVLPERSVFVGQKEPASASVVLKLRAGRALGGAEVAGIVHLVASSVAGLAPEHVAVMTTEGTVLHKPRREGEAGGVGAGEDDANGSARALEASLEERARTMLEKVVGTGHVDVRVTAEVDRSRTERVEDRYDPHDVVRSEQRTVERTGNETTAAGVPGTESNLPNASGRADGGAPTTSGAVRESTTKNYEVDHVSEKRLVLAGGVRRLTVAVVVDQTKVPRTPEELDRLSALVKSAVGADERRGDTVAVDAAPFASSEAAATPPPPPPIIPPNVRRWLPHAAGGLLAVLVVAVVIAARRRAKRKKTEAALALVSAPPPAQVEEDVLVKLDPEELRDDVHAAALRDPATAALVLRFWLGEGVDSMTPAKVLPDGTGVA